MEQKKTHWKQLVNPNYIGAYCVPSDLTVKILSVRREQVKGEGGKTEECTVAQLEGMKPFIVNRTNAKTISKVLGSPYIEDWAGKSVTIFPTTTKVAGETVECLRVRPTAPQLSRVDYSAQIKALKACTTMTELQEAFVSFTKAEQTATVQIKDEMKKLLTTPE